MALTPKQEKFCLNIASGMTQADAYRGAYDVENMSDAVIYNEASLLIKARDISIRIDELRQINAEKALVSVKSLTEELEEARALGARTEKAAAMVAATMGKAKLHGLLIDKVLTADAQTYEPMSLEAFYKAKAND